MGMKMKAPVKEFLEYEALKIEEAKIIDRLKELRPKLRSWLSVVKRYAARHGFFLLVRQTEWIYSQRVREMESDLAAEKHREQVEGVAKKVVRQDVHYRKSA